MRRMPVRTLFLPLLLSLFALPLAAQPATQEEEESEDGSENLPLEPTRSFHLDTDEGTWLSVDVSPDGQTIVFDMLGDLFTVPIAGGDATRITDGLAFDMQPRFSPDGETLLFVSDRSGGDNLWTLDLATGDTTRITKGNGNQWTSPEWAPDGQYVAASKGETRLGTVKLWLGHIEGGSGSVLTPEPDGLKTVGAAFTPDGRYVWHARRNGSWDYNASLPHAEAGIGGEWRWFSDASPERYRDLVALIDRTLEERAR